MSLIDYNKPIVPGGSFRWGEYAVLPGFDAYAIPTVQHVRNAIFLFSEIQKLRKALDKPLIITSGARNKAYTKYLRDKGTPAALKSAHMDWQAVDIAPPVGMSNQAFWQFCRTRWAGRLEHISATPTWVHFDTRDWGKSLTFTP